ncbi:MAG: DUF3107 domain-containing protein [Acidimicrobiales bacterium]
MDIRIGVTDHPREIVVTLGERPTKKVRAEVEAALAGTAPHCGSPTKGAEVAVPSSKIAFIELGPEGGNPIGFG